MRAQLGEMSRFFFCFFFLFVFLFVFLSRIKQRKLIKKSDFLDNELD